MISGGSEVEMDRFNSQIQLDQHPDHQQIIHVYVQHLPLENILANNRNIAQICPLQLIK